MNRDIALIQEPRCKSVQASKKLISELSEEKVSHNLNVYEERIIAT
jgi:hypothetical protein